MPLAGLLARPRCKAVLSAGVQPVELLRDRPWGLRDFRVVDPDGYYLRITHA